MGVHRTCGEPNEIELTPVGGGIERPTTRTAAAACRGRGRGRVRVVRTVLAWKRRRSVTRKRQGTSFAWHSRHSYKRN